MSHEIPIISLIKKGTNTFPRYVLAKTDEYRNPLYWTGSTWTSDESEAVLYNDVNQALWTYHDLILEAVSDQPCHRFVAPLYIEIYGEKPELADLRAWLEKAVRVVIDSPEYGLGPNGSVGLLVADFASTEMEGKR